MLRIKTHKLFGRNPDIGLWFRLAILPTIHISRACDCIKLKPVYGIAIEWLFWDIEINNCSY